MIGMVSGGHRQPDRRLAGSGPGHAGPRRRAGRRSRSPRPPVSMPFRGRLLSRSAGRTFFVLFSIVIGTWLCVMMYGTYIWNLCLAYYRVLGIAMSLLILVVAALCWLALAKRQHRRRAGNAGR